MKSLIVVLITIGLISIFHAAHKLIGFFTEFFYGYCCAVFVMVVGYKIMKK